MADDEGPMYLLETSNAEVLLPRLRDQDDSAGGVFSDLLSQEYEPF
jgi:hypothetical protein